MKVEIWSDIACPFCYLGKRKFENALELFEYKAEVEVIWHSYQLDGGIAHQPGRSIYEYLVDHKELLMEEAVEMAEEITEQAGAVDLAINFDTIQPANTFNAHRLLHLAKQKGLQNLAEELLFKAYFEEGQNIEDQEVLLQLGAKMGLEPLQIKEMLTSDHLSDEVRYDFHEARQLGIRGVPFFLFDGRYTVQGAQESNYFLRALSKTWSETK